MLSLNLNHRADAKVREEDNIQCKNIHCAEMLLTIKLRFASQHVVQVFYESGNCKGITACNA